MLPVGGMFISIFVGWYLDKKLVWSEIMNEGHLHRSFFKVFIFILRFVAPIGIALIFLNELGLFKIIEKALTK